MKKWQLVALDFLFNLGREWWAKKRVEKAEEKAKVDKDEEDVV